MTGLLLRYSPGEATIRSVGDQPNGIVGVVAHPAHFGFAIDSASEPAPLKSVDGVEVRRHPMGGELPEWVHPLSLSEAVEAADGPETLGNLWFALSTSLVAAAKASVGDPRYLDAVDCLVGVGHEFLECVR